MHKAVSLTARFPFCQNELKTKTGELESELVTARAAADSSTTDDTTSMELGRLQREKSRFERQVEELLQERQNLTDKLKEVKESASSKLRDLKESLREREDELDIAKSQLAEGQSVSKQLVKAKAKLKAAADVERELKVEKPRPHPAPPSPAGLVPSAATWE